MATSTRQRGTELNGRTTAAEDRAAVDDRTAVDDRAAVSDGTGTRRVGRGRMARARGASAFGSLLIGIGRVVRIITLAVVAVIVAGILLRVFDANMTNAIVRDVHDAAKWLVGPFDNLFSISKPKVSIAVNWGVAALVYLIVGSFIARMFVRAGARSATAGTAATTV